MIKEEQIINLLKENGWGIAYEHIDEVCEQEYQKIRQIGFGASDSSKLLNVNPFPNGTQEDLIKEKLTGEVDETISKKASVRTGKDLEPLIMQKINAALETGIEIYKPVNMYKANDQSGLTVNFDGVCRFTIDKSGKLLFPGEVKVVTKYGRRYYDFSKSFLHQKDGVWQEQRPTNIKINPNLSLEERAHEIGIPVYYYTQLQQQMIPLNAPFGYLIVLDLDYWDIHIFIVGRDENAIEELKKQGTLANIELNMLKQKRNPEE